MHVVHLTIVYICAIMIIMKEVYHYTARPQRMKRGEHVPIKYKFDIMEALKDKGYSSYRIRQEKIFGQKTLQDFRNGTVVLSVDCIEKLCKLLNCQIGDILEYIPDTAEKEESNNE